MIDDDSNGDNIAMIILMIIVMIESSGFIGER